MHGGATDQDQQLVLEEHGFGDDGTRAAWPGESGDCREETQNEDGQVAHKHNPSQGHDNGIATDLAIRHRQALRLPLHNEKSKMLSRVCEHQTICSRSG